MSALIQTARELGIELHGYEADHARAPEEVAADTLSLSYTNWREREQAGNLVRLLKQLGVGAKLLVWCGNSHLTREAQRTGWFLRRWLPMGWHFQRMAGLIPFALDQTVTVRFWDRPDPQREALVESAKAFLETRDGTAGFVQDRRAILQPGVDAVLLSLSNQLE
jgi:hypothetical protein